MIDRKEGGDVLSDMARVPRYPTLAMLEAFSRMSHWFKSAAGRRYLAHVSERGAKSVSSAKGDLYWRAMVIAADQEAHNG